LVQKRSMWNYGLSKKELQQELLQNLLGGCVIKGSTWNVL
jgi:hypothetical protein